MTPSLPSSARRLLALLLLAGAVVVLGPAPAQAACTCASRTVAQQAKAADGVFLGSVEGAANDGRRTTYDVQVERVYKGAVHSETVELRTPTRRRDCGLGDLPRGEPVLVFAARADEAWAADRCGGTGPATGALTRRVEGVLGAGSAPVPAPPQEAELSRVADGEPASFTRTAAPGLAMVIVGLLGLLLVRRLGR